MARFWFPFVRPFCPARYRAFFAVWAGAEPGIWQGARTGNSVALTFDDGPYVGVTDQILDLLAKFQARATFFQVGRQVEAFPDLARRVVAEGHEAANHSWTHPRLSELDSTSLREELQKTSTTLSHTLPRVTRWFRPPYACLMQEQLRVVRDLGLVPVYWSVNGKDWKNHPPAVVARRILHQVRPGDVVLLHDRPPGTIEVVARLLRGLAERRWNAVTVSELFPPQSD